MWDKVSFVTLAEILNLVDENKKEGLIKTSIALALWLHMWGNFPLELSHELSFNGSGLLLAVNLATLLSLLPYGLCLLGRLLNQFSPSLSFMDKALAVLLKILMSTSLKIILSSNGCFERYCFESKHLNNLPCTLTREYACFQQVRFPVASPARTQWLVHRKPSPKMLISEQDNNQCLSYLLKNAVGIPLSVLGNSFERCESMWLALSYFCLSWATECGQ